MARRLLLRTTSAEAGRRLQDVLRDWLGETLGRPPSAAWVRRLVMAGAVRIDGRPLFSPGRRLDAGRAIEAAIEDSHMPRVHAPAAPLTAESILYEDDLLIAVDKPPGLPTVPTADPSRPHLVGLVSRWLGERGPSEPYVGVHQRLDAETSGVVLFAKDRSANAPLAAAFAEGRVAKLYHALTRRPPGLPPTRWSVDTPLARVGKGRMGASEGGLPARTEFSVVEAHERGLWVEARPATGRTHQIRVHLALSSAPILGDTVYGTGSPAGLELERAMLHAVRLELPHPGNGRALSIASPHPADFRRALDALRTGGLRRTRRRSPGRRR